MKRRNFIKSASVSSAVPFFQYGTAVPANRKENFPIELFEKENRNFTQSIVDSYSPHSHFQPIYPFTSGHPTQPQETITWVTSLNGYRISDRQESINPRNLLVKIHYVSDHYSADEELADFLFPLPLSQEFRNELKGGLLRAFLTLNG